MAPTATSKATASRPKKTKSGSKGKRLTPFNKFMQTEMARLKNDEPELTHQDRFKLATANWKTAKDRTA